MNGMDFGNKKPGPPKKTDPNKASFLEKEQTGPIEGKKKQVPQQPGEKDVSITGGSKFEEIADLEDRIEFLQSDISDSDDGKGTPSQKAALAKLNKRLSEMRKKPGAPNMKTGKYKHNF